MTTIPAGFKLVPIEPTDAMVIEGVNAGLSHKDEPYFIYAAMLAAAPAAPACLTCNDQGAVGIILNAEPCPDCAAPAVPADGWLPIESAPKTGRTLLLGYRNSLGKWRTVRGQWMSFDYIANHWEDPDDVEEGWFETAVEAEEIPNCWRITPTHWMPLPAEPGAAPAAPVSTVEDSQDSPVALDRLADYIADNWPDKKYGLEEICQRLNATWPGAFMPAVAAPAAGDALALALAALENSQPIMKHYTEPNERHQRAIEAVRAAIAPPLSGDALTAAARDVLAERQRQRQQEGWTDERDDEYDLGELASAAAAYARYAALQTATDDPHPLRRPLVDLWPWDAAWWKPGAARRNLEKAGALVLAEIERLDRAAQRKGDA